MAPIIPVDPGEVMHIVFTVDFPWPVLSHPQEELWPVVSPWIESPLQVIEVFLIIVGNGYVNLISSSVLTNTTPRPTGGYSKGGPLDLNRFYFICI